MTSASRSSADSAVDRANSAQVALTLRLGRSRAGLSLREVARRAGTSHATLIAYEQGRKAPSVATFLRILAACGFATDFQLSPRVRERDGLARGRELEAVLDLAAQFPARHTKSMRYPKFGVS
jgi:transcriptional regulator with XRE-family HTH domain